MAGTIVADTIQDGAGNSTAMDNAIYGSAKAWINFTASGSGATVNSSYNVSSVTRNGTGDYTVTFTNAFADNKYAIVCGGGGLFAGSSGGYFIWPYYNSASTTTTSRFQINTFGGAASDAPTQSIVFLR